MFDRRLKSKIFSRSIFIVVLVSNIIIGDICWTEEITTEKAENIKKLLKVSGIGEQLRYMKDDLERVLSAKIGVAYPKIPQEFWREFEKITVSDQEMDALMDKLTPVYAQSMDHETIKKLIKMFDNPFWEKWKTKMPEISQEAGRLGGQWIREMSEAPLIQKRIEFLTEKYDLENLNRTQK